MTSSSCLPTEGNTSAFESPPDMMSSTNNNNIKPSLAAAAANDDDDDDSPPSRSSDIICLQCNDNDESMPSSSSLVIPDTSAELPSQPLWQQQDEKNSRATTHKEEFIVPMNGSGSSHIAASSSSSSLPTEKLAVKSPRLENSWMRSSPAHASTSTGTTTTTSMMMVDHGQTTIVMAELKEVDDAVIDNDNGGSSGMQQFGESDNNNNNDNRWSSSSSSGIGGGIDDSMSAAEAMLAMASPKSKEATAAMAASSFSSSAALQQQENGTDEGRDDGGGAKTSSAKGEKKSTDLLSQEGEGGGDGRGRVNSRPQHACKTLALVRKNYERIHHMQPASRALASGNTTSSTALPPTALDLSPPPSPNTTTMTSTSTSMIEFLAPQQQSKDGKVDLYQRISVEGNILSHIDSIPSTNGMVGLGLEDENQPNIRYPASFEAMNGMYPTMAAPINVPRGGGGRGHPSLKEKKGKKRGHEKISMNNKESMVAGKVGSEPKNKRSRGDKKSKGKGKGKGKGKSITFAESASDLAITAGDVDDSGTKPPPPPPSPIRILHPPKNPTSMIRTLPDFTPQPQQYTITTDHRPRRVYNPLLSLPQFPDGSDPPVDQVPQAGELWNISDIHFHDPDTYPISYLASVLGFHVPSVDGCGGDQEFGQSFDPMALVRCKEEGEQDVMTIPERGSFCNRVWKGRHHHHLDNNTKQPSCTAMKNDTNVDGPSESAIASCIEYDHGMHDDCKLTYSDPLYTNILSSYRGYNDDDFKDAGKGYLDEISPHCLEFARQRGIFGMNNNNESLSFRFATDVDEEMLTSLAQMCQWKSHPRHNLATCLRSQSHFCIVAESTSSDGNRSPIAYLQYRFCWYKVEEKRVGNVSTEKVAELVILIDNLVYAAVDNVGAATAGGAGDNMSTRVSHELETAKVMLMSLALIHACRSNIWFGMMDSPPMLVPFFTKYFRMNAVGRDGVSANDASTIPLVLDIKKCHFRYAILLLEESLTPGRMENSKDDVVSSERMLVQLRAETPITIGETAQLGVGIFSNSSNDGTSLKKAQVRLVRKSEPDDAEIFSVFTSDSNGEEAKVALNPIVGTPENENSADWNIVRLFPLVNETSPSTGNGATETQSRDIAEEIFLAELKKKQSELLALESSVESTARRILSIAYDEHLNFVDTAQRSKRELDKKKLEEYQAVQTRLQEAELAWQAQLDQDMDAVCDVCFDGEVTPENQIIFCDACNVAVHQGCYGIDQIPSGNYFCHTCTHFEIDKEYLAAKRRDGPPLKITRHPIVCELCPRRQGAFVQVQSSVPTPKAKWVHVGCAKWQGMNYIDNGRKDMIEDLTVLKQFFKVQGIPCSLCKGHMGALHQCREKNCQKWFHLTCARLSGKCSVQHGENCEGYHDPETLSNPPWTLACPSHSVIDLDSSQEESIPYLSVEQLIAIAESYPPEPVPPKSFNRMTAPERKEYWNDKAKLLEFFGRVMPSLEGAKCAVCELPADPNIDKRCDKCGGFSHAECSDRARGERATCLTCRSTEHCSNDLNYEAPRCYMCCHPNSIGPLVRATAKPVSMKKWKTNMAAMQRSSFGKNKFCHALCGLWNPECRIVDGLDTTIDCTNIAMSNGKDFVSHQHRCALCGLYQGAKVKCDIDECDGPGGMKKLAMYHVTCARQAGLEVKHDGDFTLKCFVHVDCSFVFRARLEDLREIELNRSTSKAFKPNTPITWIHASSLFHASVAILRTLGWAWRWAEWWVASGDNWEPLLEEGQVEEDMTEEELKIVHSTDESRCKDARQCRLAPFGAALRNRDYDKEDGDDQEPLERALTAVLSTKSLVGPLKKSEIDFFVTWLALAYRSKSPLLGFGDDKAPVANGSFCVHQDDGTPKYELGTRPLPGKSEPEKGVFEAPVVEVDDFLKTPPPSPKKLTKRRKYIDNETEEAP